MTCESSCIRNRPIKAAYTISLFNNLKRENLTLRPIDMRALSSAVLYAIHVVIYVNRRRLTVNCCYDFRKYEIPECIQTNATLSQLIL